jgi:hypothetical protein
MFLSRLVLSAALATCTLQAAGAEPVPEFVIKAKILSIIGGYIQWPATAERPFVLGILGTSPFSNQLEAACKGRAIQSRPVHLVYLEDPRAAECDLVFICASETARLPKILAHYKGKPVFLMGDSPDFARRGVMLNLLVDGGTITLEVNLKATRAAGLEISAAFLALAKLKTRIIDPD